MKINVETLEVIAELRAIHLCNGCIHIVKLERMFGINDYFTKIEESSPTYEECQ